DREVDRSDEPTDRAGVSSESYTLIIDVSGSPLILRDDLDEAVRRLAKRLKIRLRWFIRTIDLEAQDENKHEHMPKEETLGS
ncbi:MAG: hypothetical protein IMX04_05700, partial [Candidatus Carbobacillus altaicus]|nr:hypothetical protein [Candidatus Carbobacillus altaicus]